jgi:ketosteroid isomerase-like protein
MKSRFLASLGTTGWLVMTGMLGMTILPAAAVAQQKEIDQLLAADRAYSSAAAKTDVITGLTAMFSEKVIMPTPPGKFSDGIAAATEYFKSNPANGQSKIEWTPVRAGISADGQHGFTFGFMTVHNPDGTDSPLKYLSYWTRENGAWKVTAYKRTRRPPGEVSLALMPPSVPAKMVAPSTDAARIAAFGKSLGDAEQSFSDEASLIGLGPAFVKFGRADAMNMGREPGFTFGNEAIAKGVGSGPAGPSQLVWKSDHSVIVASSGDLGVSIGFIRQKADLNAPPFPFFTIWRRDDPTAPWRYIAE